ncbi:hypothetical protein KVR01_013120 [Diaporthe batatas]|uniref:uncharacterized protein n=1 Tax=Diaporthe batatas TaxID=748121 RepID=UPI001D044525|nr:uncharacterized protein KVR01_013120 [Diaporthe batatas]KAG8157130.1 hypothetical protein KVR01_013120 [Diaporthe batatas]
MEPPSIPSAHKVGGMPLQQRAERVARIRKNKDSKRAPASGVARASPKANDPEVAQWYALGGRTRVVFDPNVPTPGSSMIQTAQGPQENLPRPSGLPMPQVPDQASDASLDDRASLLEAPGPTCLPPCDPEYRRTNVYHTAYRLERENHALKAQLTQQEIQIDGLVRQLSESQELQKKAEQEISNLRKSSDIQTKPIDDFISQSLGHRLSGNITALQDDVSQNDDNANAALNETERFLKRLRKNRLQVEERRLQEDREGSFLSRLYDPLWEENNYMLPPRNQPQPHPAELGSKRTPIGSIPERQADKLGECERRLAELSTKLEWCEANRKKMQREWDERLAMEMKWRDDLLAIIKYNDMSRVERGREDPAALVPIQQRAEGAQGDSAGPQQDAVFPAITTTSSGTFGIFTSSMPPVPGGFASNPPYV